MASVISTLRQRQRPLAIGGVVLIAILAPLAWYLISPLFISQTVNEALPPAGQSQAAAKPVASGQFTEVDVVHKGEGMAQILTLADGKRILRFDNFKVTNGPDLFVYLSGHPMPRNREELHQQDTELGRLKGNVGSQNYELPADLDLSKVKSVVIYCKQFSVVFSTAELKVG